MKKTLMKSIAKKSLTVLLLFSIIFSIVGCEIRKRQKIVDQPGEIWCGTELYRAYCITDRSILTPGEDLTIKLVFYPEIRLTHQLVAEGWVDPHPAAFSFLMHAQYDIVDKNHNITQKSINLNLLSMDTVSESMYEEYTLHDRVVRAVVREFTIPASCFEGTYGVIAIGTYFDFTVGSSAESETDDSALETKRSSKINWFYYRKDRTRIVLFYDYADYHEYPYEPEEDDGIIIY